MQPVYRLALKRCLAWATFAFEKAEVLSSSHLCSWLKTQQLCISQCDLCIWNTSTNWISTDNLQLLEQKAKHSPNLQDSTVKSIQILDRPSPTGHRISMHTSGNVAVGYMWWQFIALPSQRGFMALQYTRPFLKILFYCPCFELKEHCKYKTYAAENIPNSILQSKDWFFVLFQWIFWWDYPTVLSFFRDDCSMHQKCFSSVSDWQWTGTVTLIF